jgi:hypothetical protein
MVGQPNPETVPWRGSFRGIYSTLRISRNAAAICSFSYGFWINRPLMGKSGWFETSRPDVTNSPIDGQRPLMMLANLSPFMEPGILTVVKTARISLRLSRISIASSALTASRTSNPASCATWTIFIRMTATFSTTNNTGFSIFCWPMCPVYALQHQDRAWRWSGPNTGVERLVAIPVVIFLVVPSRVALIPVLRMVASLPIRRIGICLAMMAAIIIVAIADRESQADIADMDAHDIIGDCRTGHRKRNASQFERNSGAIHWLRCRVKPFPQPMAASLIFPRHPTAQRRDNGRSISTLLRSASLFARLGT